MRSSRIPITAAAAALLVFCVKSVFSQSICDRSLDPQNGPWSYQQRGDRCEGLYWKPHAQEASLSLVGLRRLEKSKASSLPSSIELAWPSKASIPANTSVSIRSVLLRSDKYYQMDTAKAYGARVYHWPTDVLRGLNVALPDVGVYAFASLNIGQTHWKVYLPLALSPGDSLQDYEVTLVSGTMLLNLKWRCSRMDADGIPGKELGSATLSQRFPAGEPIRFRMTLPQYEGFSFMEVSADPVSPGLVEALHADFAFLASR